MAFHDESAPPESAPKRDAPFVWIDWTDRNWLWLAAVLCLAAIAISWMVGCTFGGGNASTSTSAPSAGGSSVVERVKFDANGKPIEKVTETKSAHAVGTGAQARGDKIDQNITGQPANITVDGVSASGGGGKSDTNAKGDPSLFANPLLYVGIICMLAGIGGFFWTPIKMVAMPGLVAGIVFLASALYPWLLAWGLIGLVLIVGGRYIYAEWKASRSTEALRATAAGVAALPPEVKSQVKAEIGKHAEAADVAMIDRIKRKDGL